MPLDPVPQWPGTGLDSLPDPSTATYEDDDGFEIDLILQKHNAILESTEAILGSTVTGTPGRGKALMGKGTDAGIWDVTTRRNRVLNGSARVQQLGTLGSTDNSHILDGWRLLLEAANAAVVTQETSDVPTLGAKRAFKFTVGSGNNNKFGMVQVLEFEDCADLRGKAVSLQMQAKATAGIANVRMAVIESTNTADSGAANVDIVSSWGADGTNPTLGAGFAYLSTPANLSVTTSWAPYYIENVTPSASMTNLLVFIWSDDKTTTQTTDILRVTDVQLEEGAVCTAIERIRFVEALAHVQQRWKQSYSYGVGVGTVTTTGITYVIVSDNANSKIVAFVVYLGTSMRAAPTITFYDNAGTSAKISTLNAAGTSTDNVTPSTGAFGATRDSYRFVHTGTIAGVQFSWTADARM